jgi:predicted ribosome quality control (RQC) complex YloA/Tae2 family protein
LPFDGIVTKCAVEELSSKLTNGRIEKIFQPENDEIYLSVRANGENLRLVLSSSANYPRIHLTDTLKENPSNPPLFCMILRKHLSGGRIVSFNFNDYERIVQIKIESTSELGDSSIKTLIIEIMGRHSNIILVNSDYKIIDSIKHVDNDISRVREIMPAREYSPPPSQDKLSVDFIDTKTLIEKASAADNVSVEKYLLNNIKGFSPLICKQICLDCDVEPNSIPSDLKITSLNKLKQILDRYIKDIKESNFKPCILYKDQTMQDPLDFYCLPVSRLGYIKYFDSINFVINEFYFSKDLFERQKQKKSDIVKVLNNSLDRCSKKLGIQQEKLREVSDRENLRLFGELITANIHLIPKKSKEALVNNYYISESEFVKIPLDENLSPQANAQRYFKKYTKAKSAFLYTNKQIKITLSELNYLESVQQMLDNNSTIDEINEIRDELVEQGYINSRKKNTGKKRNVTSKPLHFRSSGGFDIFVGKNNRQNDTLTLKTASAKDMWLHTRNIPGSHVIIKKTQENIPESTILEAAVLAACHSKAANSSNVPVDYTVVKNVKKPSGAKPGMVIYNSFRTVIVTPDKNTVSKLSVD